MALWKRPQFSSCGRVQDKPETTLAEFHMSGVYAFLAAHSWAVYRVIGGPL
jgi:hypothetical protein